MKNIYAVSVVRFQEILKARGITDENVEAQNTAFIQIGGTDLLSDYQFVLGDHNNVLCIRFDDCDEITEHQIIGGDEYVGQYPMTEEKGKIIVDFVNKNIDKETFLVHCRAGQNRSGGVTKFLSELLKQTDGEYFMNNPLTKPNRRIVSILHKIHNNYE